jgi:uncharacterized protein (DUF2336 family)
MQPTLIPELETVISHASSHKRIETLRRVTDLFLGGGRYSDAQVGLFDEVMLRLASDIEAAARAELSRRIAPLENAPASVIRMLAHDEEISVAGPVLAASPRLQESDLVSVARTRGQQHLLSMSSRADLGEAVTDVLVDRGDIGVLEAVARNEKARFSETGFSTLVRRAEGHDALTFVVGLRADLPDKHLRELVRKASEIARKRLQTSAAPAIGAKIDDIVASIADDLESQLPPARDYAAAERVISALTRSEKLDEQTIQALAHASRFEEVVVALSRLCRVPLDVVDRLMNQDSIDPLMILIKSARFSWKTAAAIIGLWPGSKGWEKDDLEAACELFNGLSVATAERVIRFWHVRNTAGS